MLSWSSTTAEMVQMAQRLLSDDKLMVGITEKCFADMALATGKSIGVMPIFSGEEVTIAGIKSTLCMLLCVNLMGAWICAEKGMAERLDPVFKCMSDLADWIERLNDNPTSLPLPGRRQRPSPRPMQLSLFVLRMPRASGKKSPSSSKRPPGTPLANGIPLTISWVPIRVGGRGTALLLFTPPDGPISIRPLRLCTSLPMPASNLLW